ncbi:MAG: metallophosphoesterase family protein [Gemmatimonadota bacterium]|nr:metallophosphoesterase family protein [Gemmatimonadota bacterium]
MELLLFSDVHRDLDAARSIVERAPEVDAVVGAGDFAVQRRGLAEVIDILSAIDRPTILVAGNGESPDELRAACEGWKSAHVLHGESVEIDGVSFFGLGAAVPVTPFGDWSYDITEGEAADLLRDCPTGAVLVSHSPPLGHVDRDSSGRHHGSASVLEAVRASEPRLVVCGHIHACWGERSEEDETTIINAGPAGVAYTL